MIRPISIFLMTALSGFAGTLTWKQLPALPDPLGVAAPYAGVTGGGLLVAGGAHFPGKMPWDGGSKQWVDRVWWLASPEGTWKEVGKLPRPLGYGISVTHGNSIICVGGSDETQHHRACFRLTWQQDQLRTDPLPDLPIALSGASGALAGDWLIVCCGAEQPGEQAATNRAFAMDLTQPEPAWQELPPLPDKSRILATAAAHEGVFYLFGGAALAPDADGKVVRQLLKDAWSFSQKDGWSRLADLPRPCVAAPSPAPVVEELDTGAEAEAFALLLAGDDGSRAGCKPLDQHPGFPDGILRYEFAAGRWETSGRVPAPRATVPCVKWGAYFVIPSGEVRPGVRSPEVWTLAMDSNPNPSKP